MDGSLLLCRFCLNTSWFHLTNIISRLNCHMDSTLQIQINQQQHVTVILFQCCLGPWEPGQYWLSDSAFSDKHKVAFHVLMLVSVYSQQHWTQSL
jgi:hypothetical protein